MFEPIPPSECPGSHRSQRLDDSPSRAGVIANRIPNPLKKRLRSRLDPSPQARFSARLRAASVETGRAVWPDAWSGLQAARFRPSHRGFSHPVCSIGESAVTTTERHPASRALVASFVFTDLVGYSKGTAAEQYAAKATLSSILRGNLATLPDRSEERR